MKQRRHQGAVIPQSFFLLPPPLLLLLLLLGLGGVAALSEGDICFTITLVVIAGVDFDGWPAGRGRPAHPLAAC